MRSTSAGVQTSDTVCGIWRLPTEPVGDRETLQTQCLVPLFIMISDTIGNV